MTDCNKNDKYISSVKVGPKGQIVIPKEVRDMFQITPGDTLLFLADKNKGMVIERSGTFNQIADAIFAGKSWELFPEHTEEESINFAKTIKEMMEETKHE